MVSRRAITDLTHPDFPHGTGKGWRSGCRAGRGHVCPAATSCTDAENERKRAYRLKRDPNRTDDASIFSMFSKRVEQVVAAAGVDAVAEFAGITTDQLARIRSWPYTTIEQDMAEPINRAWSWFVHNVDTTLPHIKHGQAHTHKHHWCRCILCVAASTAATNRSEAKIYGPKKPIHHPRARAHLIALKEAGGLNATARETGISRESLLNIASGRMIALENIPKIMRVTIADVRRDSNGLVKDPRSQIAVRSLLALGYPMTWQSEKMGVPLHVLQRMTADRTCPPPRHDAIQRFAASIGDKWADPVRDGIPLGVINRAKYDARSRGFFPPAAYNADGTLATVAPDHDANFANSERLALHLRIAYMLVSGISQDVTADKLNIERKNVQRVAGKMRLKYRGGDQSYDHARNHDITRRVKEQWNAYEIGMVGAVTACLDLGLAEFTARLVNHPEAIAWKKAHPDDAEAA